MSPLHRLDVGFVAFLPLIRPRSSVLGLAAGSGRHARLLCDSGLAVRALDRDVSALVPLAGGVCSAISSAGAPVEHSVAIPR